DHVAREISEKLIRRHPHVFGDATCADSAEVLVRWDEIKRAEKGNAASSALDGVPGGLPALLRAQKLQKKAAKVGFDWSEAAPVLAKIREEVAEIEAEIAAGDARRIEEEVGDLLFSVVNLARKLELDAETAMAGATEKFVARFHAVENLAQARGLALGKLSLA